MSVKIKLKRLGKKRNPQYRIVIADARAKRDGRSIEEIGKYHPKEDPSFIEVDSERAQYWLSVGAQPTEPVAAILKVTGDWQKFKGLPGQEGTLRVAEPKVSKKVTFEAAAKENFDDAAKGPATTPKKKAAKSADAAPVAEAEVVEAEVVDAEVVDAEVVAAVETVEVVETPEGDTVVIDEVVEVVETPDGETVVVEDVVEIVENAEGEVVEVTEVIEAEVVDADAEAVKSDEQA